MTTPTQPADRPSADRLPARSVPSREAMDAVRRLFPEIARHADETDALEAEGKPQPLSTSRATIVTRARIIDEAFARVKTDVMQLVAELSRCAGYLETVRKDRRLKDSTSEVFVGQTADWADGCLEYAAHANKILDRFITTPSAPPGTTPGNPPGARTEETK